MRANRFSLIVLIVLSAGCGGSSTSPSSTGSGSSASAGSHGSMTAVIDGKTWKATGVSSASYSGGVFAVGGSDANYILSFAVVAAGGGSFSIPGADRKTGEPHESAGNNALLIPVVNKVAQPSWVADITKGSGTITLTSLTSKGASGVFSFLLAPSSANFDTPGSRPVTSGSFTITF